jgi:hypothetical protein
MEIGKLKVCEDSKVLVEQLSNCLTLIRTPLLPDTIVEGALTSCCKIVQMCSAEKADILKEQGETDAEGKQELEEELEDIDDIYDHITDICAHLIKVYAGKVENIIVNNIMPEFFKCLTNANKMMVVSGVAFFNSVLPSCS